ncbi:MAG TPA: DUF1176 domain-containing protein, partial [Sphingomonas sp.]|nr:DUF1176 domain-containing protein [Sphingomonas sp.]
MLTFALLAALQTTAAPAEVKTFGDWAVACDNARRCEMTSLIPGDGGFADEGSGYDDFDVSIVREAGAAGGFTVEVTLNKQSTGAVRLLADGKPLAAVSPKGDSLVFTGADAERIVAAMVQAKELGLDKGGRASLAGSSAALRFIDAAQGRAGTVTAAVAKGSKPASAVPAPAPLPTVPAVRVTGHAAPVSAALARSLFARQPDCREAYEGGTGEWPEIETHALGGGKTLALLPCGAGAYNFITVPLILGAGQPAVAGFDHPPGFTTAEAGPPMLVNASFDATSGRLQSFAKGRGVGDCGSAEEYVWDGARFRLVEARAMGECRGSANWLTIWRAEA